MRAAFCLPLLSLFLVLVDGSGQAASEDDQCSLLVKFQQQLGLRLKQRQLWRQRSQFIGQ